MKRDSFMETGERFSSSSEVERDTFSPCVTPLRRTGEFSCSNHLLNILAERMAQEQRALFSGPTPPAGEFLLLLSEAASFNFDLREFFLSELEKGSPGPYARIVVLDQLYRKLNRPVAERFAFLDAHRDISFRRDDLTVEYCTLLNSLGRYWR